MDHTPGPPVPDDGQEHEETVLETVRTRLVMRTCEWCGKQMAPRAKGKGRRRRYCSPAHRQRAYEVRTARQRQERDQEAGRARRDEEPVREVERIMRGVEAVRSAADRLAEGGGPGGHG